MTEKIAREIFTTPVHDEIRDSFLAYSLSVITSRAIPDVRDGLKPVQRRILYSLHERGLRPDRPHTKSAQVVGYCMGTLHPHGDSAIYDALVRMVQDFAMRVPLVDGHGNFGSLDDPPAAMRYSECRMTQAAMEMLADIDEGTVDFRDNYDGKHQEPEVLPARLPNLLINGTSGIAVGMATNLAPHNPGEVIAAALHLLDNPDATLDDLMAFVPAPDFPTGGVLVDGGGVREAYAAGRGSFKIRAKATIGDVSARRRGITITELPYNVGTERFIARVKDLVNAKQLDGISDVKDLSDRRKGLHIVVECKTGVNPAGVLAELYAKTPLEESFSYNAVVLVNGKPLTIGLRDLLRHYLDHRLEVIVRRSRFRLAKAEARAHIVEGLLTALGAIDEVVAVIRRSKTTEEARDRLMKKFKLSETQATHILEMPLRRLTSLEVNRLRDELKELKATIADLEAILASPDRQRSVVAEELAEVAGAFASPRRTQIISADAAAAAVPAALEIPDDPCVISLTTTGLVGRSGDGFSPKAGSHDVLVARAATTARSTVRALTDTGRVLPVDASEVPEAAGRNRGAPVGEVFDTERAEQIVALFADGVDVPWCLVTSAGVVKRLTPDQLAAKAGSSVISLRDGDRVIAALSAPDDADAVLVSSDGQLLRFPLSAVRPQGRSAGGVTGMRLGEGARVVAAGAVPAGLDGDVWVLTVSDAGAVKRSSVSEFPVKGRATGGVRCMRFRRDESSIEAAHVGSGVPGATVGGKLTALTALALSKRDAAGEIVDGLTGPDVRVGSVRD